MLLQLSRCHVCTSRRDDLGGRGHVMDTEETANVLRSVQPVTIQVPPEIRMAPLTDNIGIF